jgi:hypothetical protein
MFGFAQVPARMVVSQFLELNLHSLGTQRLIARGTARRKCVGTFLFGASLFPTNSIYCRVPSRDQLIAFIHAHFGFEQPDASSQ